jgi:hypothetical protein
MLGGFGCSVAYLRISVIRSLTFHLLCNMRGYTVGHLAETFTTGASAIVAVEIGCR